MGTIINCVGIIAGGLIGILFGNRFPKSMQETLNTINGIAVMFVAIAGAMSKMLTYANGAFSTTGSLLMIISLAIGAVIGEALKLTDYIERFGEWLKHKTGNAKDPKFTEGFVTASLTVSVGAMAVVGSIEDGVSQDSSILITKAILDFVIVMVMAGSLGKGCIFSFIPVGIFQGLVTLLAVFVRGIFTTEALNAISLVGSVMIFCVGVNLVFDKKIRVANLLPSLVIAVLLAYLGV